MNVIKANPNLDGYAIYSYNSLFDRTAYADLKQAETLAITEYNNGSTDRHRGFSRCPVFIFLLSDIPLEICCSTL